MKKPTELRFLQALELRAEGDGAQRRLGGYAAVFNSLTDLGPFQERIAPGAFAKALAAGDIRALWNHNPDYPLGRTTNQTLRLLEDDRGLAFTLDLPDTQAGRDAHTSVTRGDVTGVSFGFSVPFGGDSWERVDGKRVRTLLEVELYEISPVTFPAYEATSVQQRSLESVVAEAEQRLSTPLELFALRTRLAALG